MKRAGSGIGSAGLVSLLLLGTASCDRSAVLPDSSLSSSAPALAVSTTSTVAPELPRATVDVSMPASPGTVIRVRAGGDLQAALNRAKPGDVVELQAGATFHGRYTLPAKTGSGWIVIRSSAHAQLPAGERVTRASRQYMARLVGGEYNMPVLRTAPGAHHYRIVGVEFALATRGLPALVTSIVALDRKRATDALPHHLVLDRVYIHGTPTQSLQRCVALNSGAAAIIDSRIEECHARATDSQAIGGWNGPGPYRIENNYLAGAAENIMFGGAKVGSGAVPSDIVIRRNRIHKPLTWRDGTWTVKNSLELKMARRLLIEDNVLENNWADGQSGFSVVIKSENRDKDTHPGWATTDVTFRRNRIVNSLQGISISGKGATDRVSGTGRTARVRLEDVTMPLNGEMQRGIQVLAGARDVALDRVRTNGRVWLDNGGLMRYRQENSCTSRVMSSGIREGTVTLNTRAPYWTFRENTVIDAHKWAAWYPQGSGNTYPISIACVGG